MAINKQNLATVRHNFANTTFSHKVHEMAAERKEGRSGRHKAANVGLITLVLLIFCLQATGNSSTALNAIGIGLTAGEVVLMIISLTFNHEPEIHSHKNTALKYMNLRDRYRSLIADMVAGSIDNTKAAHERDALLHEYQVISDLALTTTKGDYSRAMDELQLTPDGQNTWSDEQIDSLLPKALRIKS